MRCVGNHLNGFLEPRSPKKIHGNGEDNRYWEARGKAVKTDTCCVTDEAPETRGIEKSQKVPESYPIAAYDPRVGLEILKGDYPSVHGHIDKEPDESEGREQEKIELITLSYLQRYWAFAHTIALSFFGISNKLFN